LAVLIAEHCPADQPTQLLDPADQGCTAQAASGRYERLAIAKEQKLLALELALDEEHRSVEDAAIDVEHEETDGKLAVVAHVQKLEAFEVRHQQ
jgi:hypothetical protein